MSVKNSKIEELYSSFTRQDKDGITSFLSCNLFNQSEVIISIHLYISEYFTKYKEIDKMALYKAVFGSKEKYSDLKLRVYLTKLVKLIEEYIVIKSIEDYPLAGLSLLSNFYSKHHLSKNQNMFFGSKDSPQFESYEEELMYEYAYAMRRLDYVYQEYSHDRSKISQQFELVLSKQRDLSLFQTLKLQCDHLSYTQMYKSTKDSTNEYDILRSWIDNIEDQITIVRAYMLVYLYYQNASDEIFMKLKTILLEENISHESNYLALIAHAQNFCTRAINSGKSVYLQHLFEIYQVNLKYFKKNGSIASAVFRNMTNCALQLGKIEWAENFVATNYHLVPNSEQENTYNFNLARIQVEKGDYKNAMRQLLKVTYEDSFYASNGRILLLKCYYEVNDELPLQSCCQSLTQFLNRNKEFTRQRIDNHLHFIKYLKLLQKHRLDGDRKYFKSLYQKVNDSTVVQKEWLLKKIEELY